MDERQRLKTILVEKSYRSGTFTLTSGRTSDFYIDGKQTTLDAEGAYLCGTLLYRLIAAEPAPIRAVGGMTLGADPLATATSLISYIQGNPLPAFIVRKKSQGARHRPRHRRPEEPGARLPGCHCRGCGHHRRHPAPGNRAGSGSRLCGRPCRHRCGPPGGRRRKSGARGFPSARSSPANRFWPEARFLRRHHP